MPKLFEYIFIRIYNGYNEWGEKSSPGLYAILFISLMQCFNVAGAIFLVFDLMHIDKIPMSSGSIYLIFIFVMAINYINIYKIKGVQKLQTFWMSIDKIEKNFYRKSMYVYIVFSFLFFFLGIYLKGKLN